MTTEISTWCLLPDALILILRGAQLVLRLFIA